uniref:Uncharacterized protein n=1 Tax=Anguilla anguilla TaxID=7936 RepID=A0A0E9SSR8_ANGAN
MGPICFLKCGGPMFVLTAALKNCMPAH